ncbi:MAG: Tar ligand binding domain-containing protein [Pseudomonadota bacterium]
MLARLPNILARARVRIGTKVLVVLVGLVVLFLILGAVGLQALSAADQRTQSLIELQRRVAAYQALQSNTTALRSTVANAFLDADKRNLDRAMREIGQIAYDFDRAEFVSAEDADRIQTIKDDYAELVSIGKQVIRTLRSGNREQARQINSRSVGRLADRIEACGSPVCRC